MIFITRPAPKLCPSMANCMCREARNQHIAMYVAQTRDAARPTPHSHAALGNENKFTT